MISASIHAPWDDFSGLKINAGVRERLHEQFDVWLNMLEDEMDGKEGKLDEIVGEIFEMRQEFTGMIAESLVEKDFRRMKGPIMISLEPVCHRTDQKIRVHAFCCVLALMLSLLLKHKLQRADAKLCLERTVEWLSEVALSVIKFYDVDPRVCLLNDLNEEQKAMFDVFGLMRYHKSVSTKLR